jgi:hypothetical protein
MISGAKYSGVPQKDKAGSSPSRILASPKSATQIYPKLFREIICTHHHHPLKYSQA